MSSPRTASILARLTAEASPEREQLATLLVDHALSRTVAELIDPSALRPIVVAALTEDNLRRVVERHVLPGYRRYAAAAHASAEVVGGLVPERARGELGRTLASARVPRAIWAEGMVDPALLRRLLAPVWVHLLTSFVRRLPLPAAPQAGTAASGAGMLAAGLAGKIGRSVQERAERLVDAGRSVMGGLGAELERKLQGATRDFSDAALGIFREALGERLRSDEGRELVAAIRDQATEHVLSTRLSALQIDADSLPVEQVVELAPAIVAHARARPFVADRIDEEIRAFLATEGSRVVADLLAEAGVLDAVRAEGVRRASGLARGLFAAPAFEGWLDRLLQD